MASTNRNVTRMNAEETLRMGTYELEESLQYPAFFTNQRDVESEIECTEVELKGADEGKFCVVLENVFSRDECQEIIDWTENNINYTPALLNVGYGQQILDLESRKHDRAVYDSEFMANYIMKRIENHVPENFDYNERIDDEPWKLVALNERLRFLRYGSGEYFAPHHDGSYTRPCRTERSRITLLFYLNDAFEGGQTNFLDFYRNVVYPLKPKPGMVLLFQHDCFHEGAYLESGQKYVMRTDVMYKVPKSKRGYRR